MMKNLNILGVHGKIGFLGKGAQKKKQYWGGNCLKGGGGGLDILQI